MLGTIELVIGLAASVGVGVLLWLAANKLRRAPKGTFASGDGAATALSLFLVGCIVIVMAFSIKGGMELFPEPMFGASAGVIASLVAIFVPLKLFGKLPS